jgi:hypothetical protein
MSEAPGLISGVLPKFFRDIRIYPGWISAMICSKDSWDAT